MNYRYGENQNYEDYSSGRVLYHENGIPNFPVRLAEEIYGRCLEYSEKKTGICLYDCCCGGGYLLTVLGFSNQDSISEIIGSDIDERVLETAKANLSLLSLAGLEERIKEIRSKKEEFHKNSYLEAETSAIRLRSRIKNKIGTTVFCANALEAIPLVKKPDIIITDVPYGNLTAWENGMNGVDRLLNILSEHCSEHTVIGICMDKNQKITNRSLKRLEKQFVGKRKFELYRKFREDEIGWISEVPQ